MKHWHNKIKGSVILAAALTLFFSAPAQARVLVGDEEGAKSFSELYGSTEEDWDSEEDWEQWQDEEENSSTVKKMQQEEKATGPGRSPAVQNAGADALGAQIQGPAVEEVSLSETYHEEFQIYEESLEDLFFLYSNVSNGGITDKSVYVELPFNVTWTMEKDGLPMAYQSGQRVSARGTYVLRVTGVYDVSVPLSEQIEYRATFRFRIQEKPAVPKESGPETQGAAGQLSLNAGARPETGTEPESAADVNAIPSLNDLTGENAGEDGDSEGEEENAGDVDGENEEEEGTGDGEEGDGADPQKENPQMTKHGHSQKYDPSARTYLNTYASGVTFYSSVPEGMISAEPVNLEFPKAGEVFLYRNDQPVEYAPGDSIAQPGAYRLEIGGEAYFFSVGTTVSDMELYRAPLGMTLTEAYFGEEPLEITGEKNAFMEADGSYRFLLSGEEGETHEVHLLKDTTPPQMTVQIKGGTASISYGGEQPERVTLLKDGQPVERFSIYEIGEPGFYELTAADAAGNEATASFGLKFHLNAFAVLAMAAVVLLAAFIIIYLVKVKKSMKIR